MMTMAMGGGARSTKDGGAPSFVQGESHYAVDLWAALGEAAVLAAAVAESHRIPFRQLGQDDRPGVELRDTLPEDRAMRGFVPMLPALVGFRFEGDNLSDEVRCDCGTHTCGPDPVYIFRVALTL